MPNYTLCCWTRGQTRRSVAACTIQEGNVTANICTTRWISSPGEDVNEKTTWVSRDLLHSLTLSTVGHCLTVTYASSFSLPLPSSSDPCPTQWTHPTFYHLFISLAVKFYHSYHFYHSPAFYYPSHSLSVSFHLSSSTVSVFIARDLTFCYPRYTTSVSRMFFRSLILCISPTYLFYSHLWILSVPLV
jgi:hypothetical protein